MPENVAFLFKKDFSYKSDLSFSCNKNVSMIKLWAGLPGITIYYFLWLRNILMITFSGEATMD